MGIASMPCLVMPISLTPALIGLLAIRLNPQAGKSLVIFRKRARETKSRYASITIPHV